MLTEEERELLLQRLMAVPNRSYLWIYLTLDLIEQDPDVNKERIADLTANLPRTVDEAYDRILCRSPDSQKAKIILHIIVAAARPLTLEEMNVALAIREQYKLHDGIELQTEERLKDKLRNICGLFVTVIDSKIFLLHQTAREFLVRDDEPRPLTGDPGCLQWKHSLRLRDAHRILAEICIQFLLLPELESGSLNISVLYFRYAEMNLSSVERRLLKWGIFLAYSSLNWARHFRESSIDAQAELMEKGLDVCDTSSNRFTTWFRAYWQLSETVMAIDIKSYTPLMVASYFGLELLVKHFFQMDRVDVSAKDATWGRSALSWAAARGFGGVVEILSQEVPLHLMGLRLPFLKWRRVEINQRDNYGNTALSHATENGHEAVARLLLETGEHGARDIAEAIFIAVDAKQQTILEMLLETGKPNARYISKVKFKFIRSEDWYILKMFPGMGKFHSYGASGKTAFELAVFEGHEVMIKLLLAKGYADTNTTTVRGAAPLIHALYGVRKKIGFGRGNSWRKKKPS